MIDSLHTRLDTQEDSMRCIWRWVTTTTHINRQAAYKAACREHYPSIFNRVAQVLCRNVDTHHLSNEPPPVLIKLYSEFRMAAICTRLEHYHAFGTTEGKVRDRALQGHTLRESQNVIE